MLTLYGIPNCDTVRRARSWLALRGVGHVFHDYKKQGIDEAVLRRWAAVLGWERIINRAGTTFRKLPEGDRQGLDQDSNQDRAIALMLAQPSLIRRPMVEGDGLLLVGFAEEAWLAAGM
ncbi:arsenate reductase [uncultured Sphingomonas sp.]|uniref:arsenate reductase n=1 Tax=uncultured Sphingomonas sp. TaxID=158754 RepID=UPI0035C9628F